MNSIKQVLKQEKPQQSLSNSSVKLFISTWNKDSHGLYDYESGTQSYKTQNHKIQSTTIIYRDSQSTYMVDEAPRTVIMAKNEQKHLRESFAPIANIIFEKRQSKTSAAFRFQPITPPNIDNTNYDATKVFYKVIRQKNPDKSNSQSFALSTYTFILEPGHIVKMGRVEYMVIQMKNNRETLTIRDTNHFSQNNGVFQYVKGEETVQQEGNQIRCKICLCSQETPQDPLISPCLCKGTLLKIHVGCLMKWINSKVKKQINDIATSYNFTKFQCQICQHPFPKIVKLDGKEVQMMTISKPTKPYIMLESLNRTGEFAKEERCLHLISAKENSQIRIGRGHQCQIRLADISVSRLHAKIVFANDEFLIKDENSKFGTLIKFEGLHVFQPQKLFRVQYGRTLFEFELIVPQESDTQEQQQQMEPNEMEREPTQQAE